MATNLSLFDCKANGEDNRLGLAEREEKDRRVGVVRGTVMAAAIAIEGVGQLLQSQVTLKKYTRVYEVIYIYIYILKSISKLCKYYFLMLKKKTKKRFNFY